MSITLEDLKTLPPEDVVEVDSSLNETPPEVILELELEVEVKVLDGGEEVVMSIQWILN